MWGLGELSGGLGHSVGLMAEYDALPGIGHACGHNLICEAGVAGKAAPQGRAAFICSKTVPFAAFLGLKAAMEAGEAGVCDFLRWWLTSPDDTIRSSSVLRLTPSADG